jgi:hypothetical protein
MMGLNFFSMFIESFVSPQDALNEAVSRLGARGISRPKIVILPDGCVTVPDVVISTRI